MHIVIYHYHLGYLRLYGGSGPHEGNVYVNGKPVCDDLWDHSDARVACRWLFFVQNKCDNSEHPFIVYNDVEDSKLF